MLFSSIDVFEQGYKTQTLNVKCAQIFTRVSGSTYLNQNVKPSLLSHYDITLVREL